MSRAFNAQLDIKLVPDKISVIPNTSEILSAIGDFTLDRLGAITAFVHAAEARSFTAASRRLGISASAVGKAIARLEESLGVRLLHRSTRTITPTAEGAAFLERCRRILGEIEAAECELALAQDAPRGLLRVSLPLAGMLMMPTLTGFMAAYPDVELDLDFTDQLVDIIDEGFDAVVRAGEVDDSRLMSRLLGEFRLQLVASPGYLSHCGVPEMPSDLHEHACLHHRYATSGTLEPWPVQVIGELPNTAAANTIEPLIAMAEAGLGVACLPDFAVRRQLANGALIQVLTTHTHHSGLFRLLWPASRYPSPKLRAFDEFLVEHLFKVSPTLS